MTTAVTTPTWRGLVQRLVTQLVAGGDLRTPAWRDAMLAIPRHEFIPRYYLQDTSTRPSRWVLHKPDDTDSIQQWLELVYSPTTIITDVADYADRGVQTPVCSSTKPDLMIRMLETLDVADGMRVLEIGTGTGYNAALLAHRLGDQGVCSIDIDPALVQAARDRLAQRGYHPTVVTGDGAAGLPDQAPFDRIIATCALSAIPPAWIHQLRPGAQILVHLTGPLGAGNLTALHRGTQPVLHGRFCPGGDASCAAAPTPGRPPAPHAQPPPSNHPPPAPPPSTPPWRASHFPDCGTNRFRAGKDLSLWPRSIESIPPSFVNRRRGWSWKANNRSPRSLGNTG